jgi:hypothetical protein
MLDAFDDVRPVASDHSRTAAHVLGDRAPALRARSPKLARREEPAGSRAGSDQGRPGAGLKHPGDPRGRRWTPHGRAAPESVCRNPRELSTCGLADESLR